MASKKKSDQKAENQELPATMKVGYLGSDLELQGTRWEVPRALMYPAKGTTPKMTPSQWIESKAREQAVQAAAKAEADQRDLMLSPRHSRLRSSL